MDRRLTNARIAVISALAAYLTLGTLLTGVVPPIGVLVLVLILWFTVYRFRHKSLGNRELITKMRTDLRGTLEVIEGRLAQQEAKRRAEGERRRATRPAMDPVMSKYAAMIESRVKEGERTGR